MPLWFFPVLLVTCAVISLISAIYLFLHLQAVARIFRGTADIVPAPVGRRASRKSIFLALTLFNFGWIASILIWIFALSGGANAALSTG